MPLLKLTLVTLFARKAWFFVIFAALLLPFVLPYLTPVETNARLLEPARAQVAWSVLWVVALVWTFSTAARAGEANARTGLGAYFRSRGTGRLNQMFQIWIGCMIYVLPVVLITVTICLTAAMPSRSDEANMWVVTNLQFAALFLLTVGPLALLCVALGSRFGSLVGYVVPLTACIYGLWGVGKVGMLLNMQSGAFLEWVYNISPQYHLANLTDRLVFKMGSLPMDAFGEQVIYFIGITLVLAVISTSFFRTETLRS